MQQDRPTYLPPLSFLGWLPPLPSFVLPGPRLDGPRTALPYTQLHLATFSSPTLPTSCPGGKEHTPAVCAVEVSRPTGKRKRPRQSQQEKAKAAPFPSKADLAPNEAQGTAQVVKWKLNSPRYKRSKVEVAGGGSEWKRCEHCRTDSTPEWRTGPLGKGTLCNACGLRYRSKLREQQKRETTGSVPMSLLLNPVSTKKGRISVNNPMIWETKVTTFQI